MYMAIFVVGTWVDAQRETKIVAAFRHAAATSMAAAQSYIAYEQERDRNGRGAPTPPCHRGQRIVFMTYDQGRD